MSKDQIKPGEQLTLAQINRIRKQAQSSNVRQDGPTVEEYVAAGYLAENYPPMGFASRSTPDEIAVAIGMQAEAASKLKGPTVADIKEALAAKGVEIPEGMTKKADLQALLDQAGEQGSGEGK